MNFRGEEEAREVPGLEAMVDNWVRLGLVHVDYASKIVASGAYDWVVDRPEFHRLQALHQTDNNVISSVDGYIARTAFGEQFAKAVGLFG
jgi:hypothetical protein